jgi:muramoyltetrapeptide carboxypeptidase
MPSAHDFGPLLNGPGAYPPSLCMGDTVRVVAPSQSAAVLSEDTLRRATARLESFGLRVTFAKNAFIKRAHMAGSIRERVDDLHDAFLDPEVQIVMAAIGGWSSHQLLPHIDWDIISAHPKMFIGYSDITALAVAIHARTGLVTYLGPLFSTFAQNHPPIDYTLTWFRRMCMMDYQTGVVEPSPSYADGDAWYQDYAAPRPLFPNQGWQILRSGVADGRIIGGNLSTLRLLIGTPYCPDFRGRILFIEESAESPTYLVDRNLTQMRQAGLLDGVAGVVVGRFTAASGFGDEFSPEELLERVFENPDVPLIARFDFGHTDPKITLPLGADCSVDTSIPQIRIDRSRHDPRRFAENS